MVRFAVQQAWPRSRGALDVWAALDHPGPWLAEKIATTDRPGTTPAAPPQPPNDREAERRERLRTRRAEREESEREWAAIRAERRERREHARAQAARRRREQAELRARRREAERARIRVVPELDPENDIHVCRSSLNGIVRVFGADSPQASNARGRLARAEANARRAIGPRR